MQAELEALEKALGKPRGRWSPSSAAPRCRPSSTCSENLITKVEVPGDRRRAWPTPSCMPRAWASASRWSRRTSPTPRGAFSPRPKARAARSSCRSTPSSRYHFEANAPSQAYGVDAIPADGMILDIGPPVDRAGHGGDRRRVNTLVWNGPIGAFEMEPFDPVPSRWPATPPHAPRPASLSRWPAAATPSRRSMPPASPTVLPMCPQPAAPSWSGWKARPCQASRC